MKKELKYFLYVATIFGFIIFVGNYYFSDENKKNSYRSTKLYNEKILEYSNNLKIDTENIIEYVENTDNKDKKKYKFWELLFNNEK